MCRQGNRAAAYELASSLQKSCTDKTSVWRGLIGKLNSVFQVFAARGAAWIARKEPEHKDAEEEEDDRVNGDLEGEHGDRPASVTRASSYGA